MIQLIVKTMKEYKKISNKAFGRKEVLIFGISF